MKSEVVVLKAWGWLAGILVRVMTEIEWHYGYCCSSWLTFGLLLHSSLIRLLLLSPLRDAEGFGTCPELNVG